MLTPTWDERERPILRAIVEAEERGDDPHQAALEAAGDLSPRLYVQTIERLHADGYLQARFMWGGISRMLALGVSVDDLVARFTYIRPDRKLGSEAIELLEGSPATCVSGYLGLVEAPNNAQNVSWQLRKLTEWETLNPSTPTAVVANHSTFVL